jgi:hypothetical protein
MSALRNPQWELFSRELVELELAGDKSARLKAYEKVYGPGSSAIDNARRLANRAEIKQRTRQLFAEALEYRDVRVASVVTRIDRVGRANLADFFEPTLDNDGNRIPGSYRLKDITALPRELSEALHSIEWDDLGRPKVKLHDKNQANFTLLKHFGGLPEDAADQRTLNLNIFAGLSVDDQRALAEALEAIPAGTAVIDSEAA